MVPTGGNPNINEQPQDPRRRILMTQFMDGTRDATARTELELGPINCRGDRVEEKLIRKRK